MEFPIVIGVIVLWMIDVLFKPLWVPLLFGKDQITSKNEVGWRLVYYAIPGPGLIGLALAFIVLPFWMVVEVIKWIYSRCSHIWDWFDKLPPK